MEFLKPVGTTVAVLLSIMGIAQAQAQEVTASPRPVVGLEATPPEAEGLSRESITRWYGLGVESGVTHTHVSPTWKSVEPFRGIFRLDDVRFEFSLAIERKLPVYVNLRFIDTGTREIPFPFSSYSLDDFRLKQGLLRFAAAIGEEAQGTAKWVCLGNEIDGYLREHPDEVATYASLLRDLLPYIRATFPNALMTANFTSAAVDEIDSTYKPITEQLDFLSFTYYPLTPEIRVKPAGDARADLDKLLAVAGERKVFLQEVGSPTAGRIEGSQEQQSEFVREVFAFARQNADKVLGLNYLFMSDLPASMTEAFSKAYNQDGNEDFIAYLGTLGLFDAAGQPKPAWEVFRQEALQLKEPPAEQP